MAIKIQFLNSRHIDLPSFHNFALKSYCHSQFFEGLFIVKGGHHSWGVSLPVVVEGNMILLLRNYELIKCNTVIPEPNIVLVAFVSHTVEKSKCEAHA